MDQLRCERARDFGLRSSEDGRLCLVTPYFAHVNSAKCSHGLADNRSAPHRVFVNCRGYLKEELHLLNPDIVVTQGREAEASLRDCSKFGLFRDFGERVLLATEAHFLWVRTVHPRNGGFWKEAAECWGSYADAAKAFINMKYPGQPA